MSFKIHQVSIMPDDPISGHLYALSTGLHTCELWVTSENSSRMKLVVPSSIAHPSSAPAPIPTYGDLPDPSDHTMSRIYLVEDASDGPDVVSGTATYIFDMLTQTYKLVSVGPNAVLAPEIITFPTPDVVIDNLAARDQTTPSIALKVLVTDATDDPLVATGGAYYVYDVPNAEWVFVMLADGATSPSTTTVQSPDVIVNTIADRNALGITTTITCMVLDASDDIDITVGGATYMFDTGDQEWILVAIAPGTEHVDNMEGLQLSDIVLTPITTGDAGSDWDNA